MKARAIANTPAHVLEEYNNGEWPHKASFDRGELHPNGNFFEPDAIAVRHGICGDPEQVKSKELRQPSSRSTVHYSTVFENGEDMFRVQSII